VLKNLRVKTEPQKITPDLGDISIAQLVDDASIPVTITGLIACRITQNWDYIEPCFLSRWSPIFISIYVSGRIQTKSLKLGWWHPKAATK
jgi:hypothetical protein